MPFLSLFALCLGAMPLFDFFFCLCPCLLYKTTMDVPYLMSEVNVILYLAILTLEGNAVIKQGIANYCYNPLVIPIT